MTVSQPSTGTVDTGSQAVFLPGAVLPVTGPHRTSSRVPGLKALGTKSVLAHARAHTHPPPRPSAVTAKWGVVRGDGQYPPDRELLICSLP